MIYVISFTVMVLVLVCVATTFVSAIHTFFKLLNEDVNAFIALIVAIVVFSGCATLSVFTVVSYLEWV